MGNLLLTLCILIASTSVLAEKKALFVGALLELSNHWYEKYVNFFINIIDYVFQQVENRTDILADYTLRLVTKDTEGKNGLAAKRLFELMTEGPPIVAVLGPTLSYELTVVGQITPFYDVLQMSYIAMTSSTLSREFFPTLYMVNQIIDDLNPLRIKMMEFFNWKMAGTIFFQNDIYMSHMNNFHNLLKEHNMTLITSAVGSLRNSDIKVLVSRLAHYDVRIIMGTFSNLEAPQVFCEAYKQGLYGRKYAWILVGHVLDNQFLSQTQNVSCSYEELVEASNGYFSLSYDSIEAQNTVTIANLTTAKISEIILAKVAETNYKLSNFYGWVYDTAWSLAVGLNNSLRYLNETGLQEYINNQYYLDAILKGMQDVSFNGISGPVSFDKYGRRAGVTYIEHNFNSARTRIAMYNHRTGNLSWFVKPRSLWLGGEIPKDSFTYTTVMVAPNIPSLVLIIIANAACLLIAIGFLSFNIYYRRNSNIKLSSPVINNIIIGGSILMFTSVFLTAFDYGNILSEAVASRTCMIRVWIMCLAFTCLFGALFSKTWRVHILFRNHNLKKKSIKDLHLFIIIVFLLLMDCGLLIAWSLTHGLIKHSFVRKTTDPTNQNNIISEVYTYCHHEYEGYWFVSIYIYKGLLLAFGTFLAWETRHVVVPALNDSKFIGFCIYNVVTVCIFGVPLNHVLPTELTTLNFVLLSCLVMFCTTMCLCILFIPKIKIRHQVGGRFLNPSLNADMSDQKIIASGSISEQKRSSDNDDQKNVYSLQRDSVKLNARGVLELKNDINQRKLKIEKETMAIDRLERLLIEAAAEK